MCSHSVTVILRWCPVYFVISQMFKEISSCCWRVPDPFANYSGNFPGAIYQSPGLGQKFNVCHIKLILPYSFHLDLKRFWENSTKNKKVLLRERKRHTARRVTSARSADLFREYPILTWLEGGTPVMSWPGGYPSMGYPQPGQRYPLPGTGVSPSQYWGTSPREKEHLTSDLGKNLRLG